MGKAGGGKGRGKSGGGSKGKKRKGPKARWGDEDLDAAPKPTRKALKAAAAAAEAATGGDSKQPVMRQRKRPKTTQEAQDR
jgi:hypothetical protein